MENNTRRAVVLEAIVHCLKNFRYDIRAEVIAGDLLEQLLQETEIMVQPMSVFTRSFSPDVLQARLDHASAHQPFITLLLSRDGMYDRLPEGVFHEFSLRPSAAENVRTPIAYYRQQQQEQQQARLFFQPFENEFFLQQVLLEQYEKKVLCSIAGKLVPAWLTAFWELPADLPAGALERLIPLLPYLHGIAGNISQAQSCLQYILREKVQVIHENSLQLVSSDHAAALGKCVLGRDSVVGAAFYTAISRIMVTIGPLSRERLYEYLPDKPYGRLLVICYDYLFSVAAMVDTRLEPLVNEQETRLADKASIPVRIGYTGYL
ncbi:type VI secretion system baseplate subunit TssG [Chitinophaga nivalis]|uniref:Type VI secretion system baseplate subunit TssG n=1 Tax=Chitinophaga nivalis TaxID=2991709 RepID=A0ABT3IR79_9BACT|nr:type VI secretion system baseplate subunit TssG [Chitinophaga nivalis]MCW3463841.1 type VI secretion system baseplate subunit TssG [Chitinophaga nivalis]MCW3486469.1 type VI secretion system baseplate subunit TssG [Chitinophaga nivalis]